MFFFLSSLKNSENKIFPNKQERNKLQILLNLTFMLQFPRTLTLGQNIYILDLAIQPLGNIIHQNPAALNIAEMIYGLRKLKLVHLYCWPKKESSRRNCK